MRKSHIILLAVVVVVIAGLTALAFNKYEHQNKGITLNQAISQRNDALRDLSVEKQLRATDKQAAANQFNADQKALCQFIIAHTVKGVVIPSECTAQPL